MEFSCYIVQKKCIMVPLFGKKENTDDSTVFIDKVYINGQAKIDACLRLALEQPDTFFIAWFCETVKIFKNIFVQNGIDDSRVTDAGFVHSSQLQNKIPVFLEHYPMQYKEIEFVRKWELSNCKVYSSMDEPLFKHFGSEKMIPLIKLLGIKEKDAIEHSFVTQAINKGQQKIADKVTLEQLAESQAEWMKKNMED